MPDEQVRVTFEPHGRAVYVLPGTKIIEAGGRAGMTLDSPCGGAGICGKCRVQVTRGAGDPTLADRKHFSKEELREGWRLACQTAVGGPAVVRIPETSLFAGKHQILAERQRGKAQEVLPAVRKVYVELSPPTLADGDADLLRLEKKLGKVKADIGLLRQLPSLLRDSGFKGTAVLADHHLIDFERGDTTAQCYGAAFDIGTTTLVGSLLDLRTGEELAIASRVNPQVSFGDDVLSRIQHAGTSPEGLIQLHRLITEALREMIDELCREAGISRDRIYELSFAGNTTMQHLLCALDPTQLGRVPFVPIHGHGLMMASADINISIHRRGAAYVFPVIGGFVGGDTVAGILATRLTEQEGPILLVDIGTNGEIVLCHKGGMLAASTAAGPAFEGARISCGMRAAGGAIEKVLLDGDVHWGTIGGTGPIGLCGSGLIDLAAELLKAGIVSPQGRLLGPDELPPGLPAALRRRVTVDSGGQTRFIIADGADVERPVAVTQRDIRELQLAGGAIRAGIAILLRQAGVKTTELKRVLIAGGFGSFIRRSNAQRIGLLPRQIDHQRIQYVGNASLNGAKWALLSTEARKRAEDLARAARHVELSQDPQFQAEFAEAMIFPE